MITLNRYAYPDKLAKGMLSPTAMGSGLGPSFDFHNDPNVMVAVEDINWDSRGPKICGNFIDKMNICHLFLSVF
jgi:hypothetical protein